MISRAIMLAASLTIATLSSAAQAQTPPHLSGVNTDTPARVFSLTRTLREISGLTPAGPSSVFAHNDEYAIIHEIDLNAGVITRSFALGKPTAAGDFEGVALSGDFIYLITSDGKLYEARPAKHRKRAAYNVYDTGLGETCEIEGVAAGEHTGEFYFLCKRSTLDPARERLIVYRWTIADRLTPLSPWLNVALSEIDPSISANSFRGSDITRDETTGRLFVLDSRGGSIIELDPAGAVSAFRRLPQNRHRQAEGLAIMSNGDIVVGDEGAGKTGLLTIYGGAR